MFNSNQTLTENNECQLFDTGFVEEKFYVVIVLGSSISLVSLVENAFVFVVLNARKRAGTGALYFMIWISIFDLFMAVSFIMVVAVMIGMQYFKILWLYHAWFFYVRPMFTISNIVMVTSAYLIVAATIQRYCRLLSPLQPVYEWINRYQPLFACLALTIGILSRVSVYFELKIEHLAHCEGFEQYTLGQTNLTHNLLYRKYVMFYIRNVVSYVIPFLTLAVCNAHICCILRRLQAPVTASRLGQAQLMAIANGHGDGETRKDSINSKFTQRMQQMMVSCEAKRQSRLSSSTGMLVMIVFTWLVANSLNIIIFCWEFYDHKSLDEHPKFYALSSDITSVSTILASLFRLPIYWHGNEEFKEDARHILHQFKLSILQSQCCRRKGHGASVQKPRKEVNVTSLEQKVQQRPLPINNYQSIPTQQSNGNAVALTTSTVVHGNGQPTAISHSAAPTLTLSRQCQPLLYPCGAASIPRYRPPILYPTKTAAHHTEIHESFSPTNSPRLSALRHPPSYQHATLHELHATLHHSRSHSSASATQQPVVRHAELHRRYTLAVQPFRDYPV